MFTLQETHYATKGKVNIEDFEVFESIRKNKEKGGTMIGAHKALKPVLINEYNEEFELLVIEITVANKDIRVISGYGPQENWQLKERKPFFEALEEEVVKAEMAGKSVIVEADFNSKLGKEHIPNDPNSQSENGKLLSDIIKRQHLTVGNGLQNCEGKITRERITAQRTEQSVISFVLVSEDLVDTIESMKVDETKEFAPTRITKTKTGTTTKQSDHNVILTNLKMKWNKEEKKPKQNLFNLKNKECQIKFKEETNKGNYLSKVFEEEKDLNKATSMFMKRLNKVINKCFKKIGVKKERAIEEQEKLYNLWKHLKSKTDPESTQQAEALEAELAESYMKKLEKATQNIECDEGGFTSNKLWNLKKQMCPRSRDPPTAMLDKEGNLVKEEDKIRNIALETFEERLKNRPIKDELKHIKEAKEKLAEKLMEVAKENKTPPWSRKDLEKVLNQLKKDKSRDPHGLANEIFKNEVAGQDLKEALLKLMNRIKSEQKYPKPLEYCNISSIWKKKGPRNKFESYRGIFRVTVFRTILDKLIYNDEYEKLDKNLTDCNVGGRKARNIRDNIFVLNAILNNQKGRNSKALDIQVYDVETCFDALWLHEVITCLYNAGIQNDKLPLLFLENENAQVAAKVSNELSKRISIRQIIMQGSVWGSLCCVVLMDKLGKLTYARPELLYYYKGIVEVPTLQMVDDILGIQKCSPQSKQLNTVINTFMDLEKLTLSKTKCSKIHIGKQTNLCSNLKVGEADMKDSASEKYLGDIVHKSGNQKTNIEARIAKGKGIVKTILAMIQESPLGWSRVKAGLILREAMLINGIMFNAEAWHGVRQEDVDALEQVDQALLRGLVDGHAKTPVAALYLELGCIPLRYIWASRRIMYLHTILTRNDSEVTKKIYEAQKINPNKGDFAKLVKVDLERIKLNNTEDEIKAMKKGELKSIVKRKVREAALEYLNEKKGSKLFKLRHTKLETTEYLKSPRFQQKKSSLLFALRTRTVRGIRSDFGGQYQDKECPLPGCSHPDTLANLLTCPIIRDRLGATDATIVAYEDVFSQDIGCLRKATDVYEKILDIRKDLEEDNGTPAAAPAGPLHLLLTAPAAKL